MRVAAAILTLLVMACGSTSVAARPSPSPSANATSVASPSASASASASASPLASPSPSPASSPSASPFLKPSAVVALPAVPAGQCALPVEWEDMSQQDQVGFLLYPAGTVVSAQPLPMSGTEYYDSAVQRWLPVPANAVSPDGLQFAYAEYDQPPSPAAGMDGGGLPHDAGVIVTTGRVHVVDAGSGADRIVYSGSPTYAVAGFTADGIYLTQVALTMDGQFPSGLFLLPATGGTPKAVPGGSRPLDRGGWTVLGGYAWGSEWTAGDGGLTQGNQLDRLDLKSGTVTVWLTKPGGTSVGIAGFDEGGVPLVAAGPNGYSTSDSPPPVVPAQLLAVAAPQQASILWQANASLVSFGPAFDDSHGAWIDATNYLLLDAGGKVTQINVPISGGAILGNACLA